VRIWAGATVRVLGMVFTATQLTLVAIAAVALAALHGLLRYTLADLQPGPAGVGVTGGQARQPVEQ
jgi:hypothetical protein